LEKKSEAKHLNVRNNYKNNGKLTGKNGASMCWDGKCLGNGKKEIRDCTKNYPPLSHRRDGTNKVKYNNLAKRGVE